MQLLAIDAAALLEDHGKTLALAFGVRNILSHILEGNREPRLLVKPVFSDLRHSRADDQQRSEQPHNHTRHVLSPHPMVPNTGKVSIIH